MILLKKLKIAIFLSLIIISLSNVVLSNAISFEGKIHKNIYLEDINLSNLTKEEAISKINDVLNKKNTFVLRLGNKEYVFQKDYIDTEYKVKEIVDEAYAIGRNKDVITNIRTKTDLNLGDEIILNYKYNYNERKLKGYLNCLYEDIYKSPINSTVRIKDGDIVISKEEYGYELDKEKMESIIISKVKKINCQDEVIPIMYLKPNNLYSELSKIDTMLGRFETHFNPKNENRSNNIRLASKATNNILLKPNEVFSFNENIQNSHIQQYFKEAPVIINGKQDKGKGGGMCQVSSTIYNAALYSGLKILNVTNHSIPSPYIEKGRDATVCNGYIDLKFSNSYNTPVFIYNQVYENKVISTIYGSSNDKKDIEIYSEITKEIPNESVIKNSEDLELGTSMVKQEGRKGYKVKTYRIYKTSPDAITEYISESYYPPEDKITLYGIRELSK